MNKFEENLIGTRKQLVIEISSLSYDEFNRQIEVNRWSIAQICHHLLITETLFTKAIVHGLNRKNLTKAERKPIHIVSDKSKKFKAPKNSEPSSEAFQVSQMLQLLIESRKNLMDVLSKIDDMSVLKEVVVKHPVFDDLPLDQWIELLYLHEQRHIEQINDLKALR